MPVEKAIKTKLAAIAAKHLEVINQPVTIREIITATPAGKGEYYFRKRYLEGDTDKRHWRAVTKRMLLHIYELAKVTELDHQARNCDLSGKLKPGCLNNITRLNTTEFSFYTQNKPLPLRSFQKLIKKLKQFTSTLAPNLHLLLSSFSVAIPAENGTTNLYNVVVYVQCGPRPKFNVFTKANPHQYDPVYKDSATGVKSTPVFDCGGLVECETEGGAKFNTLTDICVDEKYGVAKSIFKKNLSCPQGGFFPKQISHVVTANSLCKLNKKHIASETIVHADADPQIMGVKKYGLQSLKKMPCDAVPQVVKNYLAPLTHEQCIYIENNIFTINRPNFGGLVKVTFNPEYQLATVKGGLKKGLEKANKKIFKNSIYTMFAANTSASSANDALTESESSSKRHVM